jgi:hypothetical protein
LSDAATPAGGSPSGEFVQGQRMLTDNACRCIRPLQKG